MRSPRVSVVIPCRNERTGIEAALHSILRQESPVGGYEVIVADAMSDDGTRDVLQRYGLNDPRIKVIDNPGLFVSSGLNAAIRASRGAVIIRMDAHSRYAPDYLRRCVETLEETGADNVGGPWVAEGIGIIGRAVAAAFQSPFAAGGTRGRDPSYSGPVDTVYLGCWPRELFNKIGLFDEEFVRNQDDEFNLRIVRGGGTIWQSVKIRSRYQVRESLRALFAQYAQYGYWKARILQKHKLPASVRHIVPACFVLMLLILPVLSIFSTAAFWTWASLVISYLVVNISVSILTAASSGWNLLLLLPLVFSTFHLAYGWGFLKGFVDFIILRRKPSTVYTALTRFSGDDLSH
jgi:glycosyltransferase involved in cell wall biosynthesis